MTDLGEKEGGNNLPESLKQVKEGDSGTPPFHSLEFNHSENIEVVFSMCQALL